MSDDDNVSSSSSSGSSSSVVGRPKGPLGIDPLHFSIALFILLILYVFYLMLPRALRKQYFGSYPKRHAWSARSRNNSRRSYGQVRIFIINIKFIFRERGGLPRLAFLPRGVQLPPQHWLLSFS